MADDRLRNLRRLAKSYGIFFRLPSHAWPAAHSTTFQNIKKLGDRKFDSYCENVNIRSHEEPWTEQTKHRAEWLANRASRLFGQERNEAGWRFGLENDVLRRFSVEVACPKCRARVWRSEIEAGLDESGDLARNLEQRKRDRTRCQCSPDNRPQDYYEIGTNPLFDDRAQELIIHDLTLRSELPKQEPDRIYGLQKTRNFEDLLSRSMPCTSNGINPITVGDMIRSSPFKAESDPLLFPFLVLEAKKESSSSGFDDIQAQTAFPIWTLLKLQEGLQSHKIGSESSFEPLVWFIATRGDAWRVYGCSITGGANNGPNTYDIYLLWSGSMIFKDSAIQLVLIIDYILDWARDVYRPSILRHLKSIATGKAYDEISLAGDSDVFSMRRNISSWIPAPPSTVNTLDLDEDLDQPDILPIPDQPDLLPIPIPNTKLGSIRSAAIITFRFVGLYITQNNVTSLLQLAAGRLQNTELSEKAARELVNFVTRWDEILLLTGADLDELEYIWTGDTRSDDTAANLSSTEEFYVLLESRCFISSSWEITKEITSLSISKSAFEILMTYTNFKKRHQPAESLSDIARPCQMTALRECVECLKSGSPWQVLLCAISCLLVSLYPIPERKRADFTPTVNHLGFGYRRFSRVKPFIQKFLEYGKGNPARRRRAALGNNGGDSLRTLSRHGKLSGSDQSITDLSFQRLSETRVRNCEAVHDPERCSRCGEGAQDDVYTRNLVMVKPPVVSTYGAILVESPNGMDSKTVTRHDLCLFVVENSTLLKEKEALPLIVEDILQTDMLHHTFTHAPFKDPDGSRALLWNLPFTYRPPTEEQRINVMNWCQELLGRPIMNTNRPKDQTDIWVHTQMLLHFLRLGYSHFDANIAMTQFCQKFPDMVRERNEKLKQHGIDWGMDKPDRPVTLDDFFMWFDREIRRVEYVMKLEALFPPSQLTLKGDIKRKLALTNGKVLEIAATSELGLLD